MTIPEILSLLILGATILFAINGAIWFCVSQWGLGEETPKTRWESDE